MLRRLHQPLMLVLAAQIDRGCDGARQLPHTCHATVKGDARAAVRRHTPDGNQFVGSAVVVNDSQLISRSEPIGTDSLDPACAIIGSARFRKPRRQAEEPT